jgi:hypothetical protein
MKRKQRQGPTDDPGITRLPPSRTYRLEDPKELAAWLADSEVWIKDWNESKTTFDGRVAPIERLAHRLAPKWGKEPRRRSVEGTLAWLGEEILTALRDARLGRGSGGDSDLIEAFEAGLCGGHLMTKLNWEREALTGERVIGGGREGGGGGRKRIFSAEDIERLETLPRARRGREIDREADRVGVKPAAIRARLRRARKRR